MASQPRPILSTMMSLLLCSALLAFILQGAQGEVDVEGPSESQCRPFIEKALKEKLETGDTLKESTQPLHIEDIVTTEVINDNSEDKQGESIETVTEEISQSSEIVQTSESGETEQETDETTQTEPKESVEEAVEEVIESVKESAEETIQEVVEDVVEGAVEEASAEATEDTVTSSEHVQESIEVADEAAESAEQTIAETTEETSKEETKEETSAETTEAPSDGSEEQASQEEQTEQSSTEKESSAEVKTEEHVEETSAEKEESAEKESGTEESVNVESENASVEQEHETSKEAESAEQQHSAEDTKSEEEIKESSVEQEQTETESESTEKSHTESGEEVEQASAEVVESVTESTETVEEVTEKETEDSNQVSAEQADAPHASAEQVEAEQASAEQVESEQASAEQVESEQASVEQVEVEHASAEEASAEQAEIENVSAEQVEAEQASVEQVEAEQASVEQASAEQASVEQASAEQTEAAHASVEEASVEQTEAEHASAEQADAEQASVEQTETEHVSAEQADAPAESTESVEEPKEPAEEKSAEVEVTESAEKEAVEETAAEETVPVAEAAEEKSEEDSAAAETESEPTVEQEKPEPVPVEELTSEFEIPENLRSREHINQYLHLNEEDSEKDKAVNKVADVVLKELKRLYETAIKPLEILYKYRDLSNRHFGDPEIFSKPLVLFMGPWSGGKSSLINYLLDNEYTPNSLRTGAEPSPAYFNILMWGSEPEVLDGTQLAADWTFSGLQKFGQGLEERLRGLKLPNKLLEKVNIVEIPGILEVRKQVSRVFPFNDACQWFIDRADIIFLVYDPSKLDVGPETEAILDQLKGREYQTRIILNKADQVKPEELMRVQGALIWNISPLMSSAQPPVMYTTSLWSRPYEVGAPMRLLHTQEVAFLKDLQTAIEKRIENKISSARRFAVRVRNHAKMVDCYLTTYYNHKSVFGNKKLVADQIIEHPQDYHIYEGLSTLTNISRYDLPDPDVYRDFFRLNALYDFQQLSATCTYFRGCPINRLDISIAYDLPELVSKYKKALDTALANLAGITDKS